MEQIRLTKTNALRYADAVGDFNPIHRTEEGARVYGLDRAIAPGMWLASHIQKLYDVAEIKQISFQGNAYYGDAVEVVETPRRLSGRKGIEFRVGDSRVCSVDGIKTGGYSPSPKPLKETAHTYSADVCEGRIRLFLDSIGCCENDATPKMYLASLCAPALLNYGSTKGIYGIQTSLSFQMHSDYELEEIQLKIGDERTKKSLIFFELRWMQKGECMASGRAGVLPLSEKTLEEKIE